MQEVNDFVGNVNFFIMVSAILIYSVVNRVFTYKERIAKMKVIQEREDTCENQNTSSSMDQMDAEKQL